MALREICLRMHAVATVVAIVAAAALAVAPSIAHAAPGVAVFPGMEIRQDTNMCTLTFVDMGSRTGFTAGHCRAGGSVGDRDGNVIGHQTMFRDNTPDGATISTDHQIADWEAFQLAPDVALNNVLPGGRVLIYDPAVVPAPGLRVCHFGVVTGESCGTVDAINNGWFTMGNGVVSQKGDSGGPVYASTDDGRAAIVGMFNSTWGQFPVAVSWPSIDQQVRDDVYGSASVTAGGPPAPPVAPA
jgi:hypothetical protein